MTFKAGDCISFKIDNLFLAGFITSITRGKYEIALYNFNKRTPPSTDYFQGGELFSIKYELGETSISSLDVITIDIEDMDQLPNVELITHIEIPGFLNSSGFQEIIGFNDLKNYFDLGVKLRNKKVQVEGTSIPTFEIKCFISISEFLKSISPRNDFPTIKLYKNIDNVIHYWQIYGSSIDPLCLVIHWGRLGETGEFIEIKDRTPDEMREIYKSEIAKQTKEGYQESENRQPMVLQFKTSDEWGGTDDLEFRNEIWDYLDKFLFWTGNGSISGGDIGSGTVNLFFEAVTPEIAISTIVHALEEKKVDQPFLIALENDKSVELPDDDSIDIKVLYPKDYQGTFFY